VEVIDTLLFGIELRTELEDRQEGAAKSCWERMCLRSRCYNICVRVYAKRVLYLPVS